MVTMIYQVEDVRFLGNATYTFAPGMIAVLKSGGPLMTVRSITQDGLVLCEWYITERSIAIKAFKPRTIRWPDREEEERG
jgi:uncharacterized protein YodC (DUF2158 family)